MATAKRIAMKQAQVQQELLDQMASIQAKLDQILKLLEEPEPEKEPASK